MSSYQLVVDKYTHTPSLHIVRNYCLIWCNNWSTVGCWKTRNAQERNGTKQEVIVHNMDAGHVARN